MKNMGKKLLYILVTLVLIFILFLAVGFFKDNFFNREEKVAEAFVSSLDSGSAFRVKTKYYSKNKDTGNYTTIDFDGTTYKLEDHHDGDKLDITCKQGEKKCYEIENYIKNEKVFIDTYFDKAYDQKIYSDDNYSYSEGTTQGNQKYKVKLSNDGKSSVDEFDIEGENGAIISINLK